MLYPANIQIMVGDVVIKHQLHRRVMLQHMAAKAEDADNLQENKGKHEDWEERLCGV